jgi:hypothetical protein
MDRSTYRITPQSDREGLRRRNGGVDNQKEKRVGSGEHRDALLSLLSVLCELAFRRRSRGRSARVDSYGKFVRIDDRRCDGDSLG